MIRFTIPALALALSASPVGAAVLDFNDFRPASGSGTTSIYGPIVEDGFSVSSDLCEAPSGGRPLGRCLVTVQPFNSIDPAGASIITAFQGRTITVERVGGGVFTFDSFDLRSSYGTNPTNVDIVWTLASGGTGSQRFALAGSSSVPLYTLSVPGLGPITRLRFDPVEANGAFQFDNIRVTAVPEPASWALVIGGFGLVGGVMRRRGTTAPVVRFA